MSATLLTPDEIREKIAEREGSAQTAEATEAKYRYVQPLSAAADGLIEYAQNPQGRFMLGLPEIDAMTRGFGAGELVYVTGRSHSGKTQVVLNALGHNNERNVILFTADEVAELVLAKLISITQGVDAEQLEERVKAGDSAAVAMVRHVASRDFARLIVVDEPLTFAQMTDAIAEARHFWGGEDPDCVVIDYLELVPGSGDADGNDGVQALSKAAKRWSKALPCPALVLRQNSRGSGKRGQAAGMSGMSYGGENEAIMVLEVYRKAEDPEQDQARHRNTVTVTVSKNKRPPAKKGERDFYMDPSTGVVRPLMDGDTKVGVELTDSADAMAARRAALHQAQTGPQPQPYDRMLPIGSVAAEEPF